MDICKISNCQFNVLIPMALTDLWTELISCLAVVLTNYGVLLETIPQLVTGRTLVHGYKKSLGFLGYKD